MFFDRVRAPSVASLTRVIALAFAAIILFAAAPPAVAQDGSGDGGDGDDEIITDEESLFGAPDGDSEDGGNDGASAGGSSDDNAGGLFEGPLIEEVTQTAGLESSLLTAERVEIGGRYHFSAESSWSWNDPAKLFDAIPEPDSDSASVDLGATIFFDARPDEDFRALGKTSISYPFTDENGTRSFDEVFHIDELFSDFNWDDKIFFRGGKHTINWGVGYFFSPADLLNITEIDPEDPESEPEGPVSLKMQIPISMHNLYAYAVANRIDEWNDIGVAAKGELVLGSAEIGAGAFYQNDVSPSGMLTVTMPIGDVDLFGEAVLRYGSDRTFVEESSTAPLGVTTATYDDELFFNGTAGFSYRYTFDEVDSSMSIIGQYLYNGEGYDDPSILSENPAGVAALRNSEVLTQSDLRDTGKHYAAANAGWNGVFGSDLTLSAFWIHNFSDMSGYVAPKITLSILERMDVLANVSYRYGDEGDEYTPIGDGLTVSLRAAMGGGSF